MNTVQRLKDLLGRATPGPWHIQWTFNVFGTDTRLAANCGGASSNRGDGEYAENVANTKLITESRNALPALLAVVEAAEKFGQVVFDGVDFAKYIEAKRELTAALAALNTEKTNEKAT